MIALYAHQVRTVAGWAWCVRLWAHRHPVLSRILTTLAVIGYFVFVQTQAAHAAGFLPDGVDYLDSHGNAFSRYALIDIAPGDVLSPGVVVANFIVQTMWSVQYFFTGVILWLFDFLLSFQWVEWLAAPFNALAIWLQGQLGQINWIPFALMISALVGGIALFRGRVAGGLWEMLVAAVIAALAVGVLANPVAVLTAAGGVLGTAQDAGSELATSIVVDPAAQTGDETLSTAVNATLMDVFVRTPYQVISYSEVLPDACQAPFDQFIQSGEPQASLTDCAPDAAKFAHDHPGGANVTNAWVNGSGVTVMFLFGMVIAGLLLASVLFFLVAAIKSMLLLYLCILPVDRAPLWRAISDSFMGTISLTVMTVCLALYLKLTTWIMSVSGGIPHQLRMVLLVLFLILVIVLVWRARRSTMQAGRGVAGHLSKLGLGMKPTATDSNTLMKMSAVTSMANSAAMLMRRRGASSRKPVLPGKPLGETGSAEPEPITLRQVYDPSSTQGARPGSPSVTRRALAATAIAGRTAQTATVLGKGALTVAKGASVGGAGGAVAAGAGFATGVLLRRGKDALTRKAGSTVGAAAGHAVQAVSTPRPAPADIGELKVVTVRETPSARISVDSRGVATARRKPAPAAQITTLPRTVPQSPRALERRRQLEAYRPPAQRRG